MTGNQVLGNDQKRSAWQWREEECLAITRKQLLGNEKKGRLTMTKEGGPHSEGKGWASQ